MSLAAAVAKALIVDAEALTVRYWRCGRDLRCGRLRL